MDRPIHNDMVNAMIEVNGGMTGGRLGGGNVDERADELIKALNKLGVILVTQGS